MKKPHFAMLNIHTPVRTDRGTSCQETSALPVGQIVLRRPLIGSRECHYSFRQFVHRYGFLCFGIGRLNRLDVGFSSFPIVFLIGWEVFSPPAPVTDIMHSSRPLFYTRCLFRHLRGATGGRNCNKRRANHCSEGILQLFPLTSALQESLH